MEHWTLYEIYADLRGDELRRAAPRAPERGGAGGLRRRIAQRLVGLGLWLDATAWGDATRPSAPRLSGSDA